MGKSVPCKDFYCPRAQAENYLYCDVHKDGKQEVDDVVEAVKHAKRRFDEAEDTIVIEQYHGFGGVETHTLVQEQFWNFNIEEVAEAWDVHATAVENELKAVLFDEYGEIVTGNP